MAAMTTWRRAHEKTQAFVEVYRFRADDAGTLSDLDRISGFQHLRVRGMVQVRLSAVLKATGKLSTQAS